MYSFCFSSQEEYAKKFRNITKDVYDSCKDCEVSRSRSGSALPELITQDFDEEQIWQQLELQNDNIVNSLLSVISGVVTSKDIGLHVRKKAVTKEYIGKKRSKTDNQDRVEGKSENVPESPEQDESGTDEEISKLRAHLNDDNLVSDEIASNSDEDDLDFDFDRLGAGDKDLGDEDESDSDIDDTANKQKTQPVRKKGSVVDDKFFKLADMEAFLEQEDAKEMKKQRGEEGDESSEDDEDIDMFADISSEDEVQEILVTSA